MTGSKVILNAAMTLDGKISTRSGDSEISCEEDLKRVHELRAKVDGIIVGIGTVLVDDPALTVRLAEGENPTRIVVDSRGRTPSDAKVLSESASTVIAVSHLASEESVERLQDSGADDVIIVGSDWVDLPKLLDRLNEKGINKLLLEGGSTLNWSMLEQGLVDEIRVAVAPRIVGGEEAKTLVDGEGFEKVSDGVLLEFEKPEIVGDNLLLVYRVKGRTNDKDD